MSMFYSYVKCLRNMTIPFLKLVILWSTVEYYFQIRNTSRLLGNYYFLSEIYMGDFGLSFVNHLWNKCMLFLSSSELAPPPPAS